MTIDVIFLDFRRRKKRLRNAFDWVWFVFMTQPKH